MTTLYTGRGSRVKRLSQNLSTVHLCIRASVHLSSTLVHRLPIDNPLVVHQFSIAASVDRAEWFAFCFFSFFFFSFFWCACKVNPFLRSTLAVFVALSNSTTSYCLFNSRLSLAQLWKVRSLTRFALLVFCIDFSADR